MSHDQNPFGEESGEETSQILRMFTAKAIAEELLQEAQDDDQPDVPEHLKPFCKKLDSITDIASTILTIHGVTINACGVPNSGPERVCRFAIEALRNQVTALNETVELLEYLLNIAPKRGDDDGR